MGGEFFCFLLFLAIAEPLIPIHHREEHAMKLEFAEDLLVEELRDL